MWDRSAQAWARLNTRPRFPRLSIELLDTMQRELQWGVATTGWLAAGIVRMRPPRDSRTLSWGHSLAAHTHACSCRAMGNADSAVKLQHG